MSMKSTSSAYGKIALSIHWISALLIVTLLISGFRLGSVVDPELKLQLLKLHAPLGILILAVTVFRVLWWGIADKKPLAIQNTTRLQQLAAKLVHVTLYLLIFGMSASGIGMMVLSGAGEVLMSGIAENLPVFSEYLPRIPHGIGARIFVLILVFHIGAALVHHLVFKDDTLRRIWFSGKSGT